MAFPASHPHMVFPISHPYSTRVISCLAPTFHTCYFLPRIHTWYFLSRTHMRYFLSRIHTWYFLSRIHTWYFLSRIHIWHFLPRIHIPHVLFPASHPHVYFLSRIHMWHFLPRIHTRRTSSHISTQDDLLYIQLSYSAQCIGPRWLLLLWCCTDISSGAMTRQYCSAGRSVRHPRQMRRQLTQYNVPSSLTGCNKVGVSPGRGDSGATAEWAASCGAPV